LLRPKNPFSTNIERKKGELEMGFIEFIQKEFFHAAPTLAAGLFGLVIILERFKALTKTYPMKNGKAFFEKIQEMIEKGQTNQAVALCDQYIEKPVARVVKTAISRGHLPDEAIEQGINITMQEVSNDIQKRTAFLATIANVATLMGLFGTIAGLIASFKAVATADPQLKSTMLSDGISTAMNATMLGLGVAIPCMVAFSFLMSRSNRIMAEVEEAALKTVDALKLRYFNQQQGEDKSA
jgi:biopolymer transport protein ExbB